MRESDVQSIVIKTTPIHIHTSMKLWLATITDPPLLILRIKCVYSYRNILVENPRPILHLCHVHFHRVVT